MDESQLPDHLTYVLEFAAGHDLAAGVRILLSNRAGIELLRLHLAEIDSPWAGTIRAVCATLPALDGMTSTPSNGSPPRDRRPRRPSGSTDSAATVTLHRARPR
jgi:nitrate reductase assembly molybdenum cofactor insertion protein NarJ